MPPPRSGKREDYISVQPFNPKTEANSGQFSLEVGAKSKDTERVNYLNIPGCGVALIHVPHFFDKVPLGFRRNAKFKAFFPIIGAGTITAQGHCLFSYFTL